MKKQMLIGLAVLLIVQAGCSQLQPAIEADEPLAETQELAAASNEPAPMAPVTGYQLTYVLANGNEQWPADKRQRIVESMDFATGLYNQLGQFPKNLTAAYSPGTPTADASYSGYIRFGGSINERVALHEIAHTLGVGQHPNWWKCAVDGIWTGPHAIAQLRAFDGPDAVLHADRMHFWPYGLNYDKEGNPENFRRCVLMVAAMRRDMGIVSSEPIKGRIGVGTWATQAEYKDIKVTKYDQTLYASDFSKGMEGWEAQGGTWEVVDGALRQISGDDNARALLSGHEFEDCTLSMKARKLGGKEGFLIIFGSPGDATKTWWNIGGYGNTKHVVNLPDLSARDVAGSVETDRWYDIRVEIEGCTAKCYLDGELLQEGRR
ncbi:hypothetical protein JXA32_13350 [Candidatus Sumerlaeota bacterium]|nr:hypothetical protein [Candidatus Sumerlaeota bacterium]